MSKEYDSLSKEIKILQEHIKMYPHSMSTPVRKIRLEQLKKLRSDKIGK